MMCPGASRRMISGLFRADGDHITDLDIPAFSHPIDVVCSGIPAYSNTRAPKHRASRSISRRSPTRCRRRRDAPLCRLDRLLAGFVRPPPVDRSVRESELVAKPIQNEAGLMTTRFVIATTAAVLLACGPASAQLGKTVFPGAALGMTSPLGVGPSWPVPQTRIPLGATELASPGVSPTMSGTFPEMGGITTCAGGSALPASAGVSASTPGSSMNAGVATGGSASVFDGGGMSGSASGGCGGASTSSLLPGPALALSPAAGSVSSVGRVGIPMGSTEVAVGGLTPPSVADDADSPGCAPLLQPVDAAFHDGECVDGEHGLVLADRHRCPFDHRRDNAVRITFVGQGGRPGGDALLTSLCFDPEVQLAHGLVLGATTVMITSAAGCVIRRAAPSRRRGPRSVRHSSRQDRSDRSNSVQALFLDRHTCVSVEGEREVCSARS
jgi:hypothetical protein